MKNIKVDLGSVKSEENQKIEGDAIIVENEYGNKFIALVCRDNDTLTIIDSESEEIYSVDYYQLAIGNYADNYKIVAEVELDIIVKRYIKMC